MKRPREDSSGESDDEATKQSRGPSVSLEGGDFTSQGEEENLPAVEMDVERGEGEHVEIEGQEESGKGQGGEKQEQGEGEPQEEKEVIVSLVRENPREEEPQGEGEHAETEGQDDPEVVGREREIYQDFPEDIERVENQVQRSGGGEDIEDQREREWNLTCEKAVLEAERALREAKKALREAKIDVREAEEDLRLDDDLDTLRSRQSEMFSLKYLALRCISNNTDYFQTVPEQLNALPVPIFQLVVNHIEKTGKSRSPDVLPMMISEKTRELSISIGDNSLHFSGSATIPWSIQEVHNILGLVEKKCKTTLTTLHLIDDLPEDQKLDYSLCRVQLSIVLSGLENLTDLCIDGFFNFNDDILVLLGLRCKKLKSLKIQNHSSITNVGIDCLCGVTAPFGGCKDIETLLLDGTSVDVDGLVSALINLHKLKILSHELLLPAIQKFVEMKGVERKLQLTELSCERDEGLALADNMELVIEVIPHVTSIMIHKLRNLGGVFNNVGINSLQLTSLFTTLSELNFFVNKFSSTLTSCHLSDCSTKVDLSVFGHCPNLENLQLWCNILPTCEFQLFPESFMKLYEINLIQEDVDEHDNAVPVDISYVIQMLSSPHLGEVSLTSINLPDTSLHSLILEAKEHRQVFLSLFVFQIRDNRYSAELWMQFLCVCPNLEILDCVESLELCRKIKRFAERNNLKKFEFWRNGNPF